MSLVATLQASETQFLNIFDVYASIRSNAIIELIEVSILFYFRMVGFTLRHSTQMEFLTRVFGGEPVMEKQLKCDTKYISESAQKSSA